MPAQRIEQPFLWNSAYGYEYIPFTGLYHVGAREYDPRTARWLQRDPIDVAGGHPNVYLYCGNDPLNMADDGGTEWFKKTADGVWIGPFLFNSEVVSEGLKTGFATVGSAFSLGLWDGGAYKDQPGFQTSTVLAGVGGVCLTMAVGGGAAGSVVSSVRAGRQVQQAANIAQRTVGSGRGPVHGTRVHTEFARQVQQISKGKLHTEFAYRNGVRVNRNTPIPSVLTQ